jgi:hypothetical protein
MAVNTQTTRCCGPLRRRTARCGGCGVPRSRAVFPRLRAGFPRSAAGRPRSRGGCPRGPGGCPRLVGEMISNDCTVCGLAGPSHGRSAPAPALALARTSAHPGNVRTHRQARRRWNGLRVANRYRLSCVGMVATLRWRVGRASRCRARESAGGLTSRPCAFGHGGRGAGHGGGREAASKPGVIAD